MNIIRAQGMGFFTCSQCLIKVSFGKPYLCQGMPGFKAVRMVLDDPIELASGLRIIAHCVIKSGFFHYTTRIPNWFITKFCHGIRLLKCGMNARTK